MVSYYKLLLDPLDATKIEFVKTIHNGKYIRINDATLSLHRGKVEPQPNGCGGLKIHENGKEPQFFDYEDSNEADYIRAKEAYWDLQDY